MPGVTLRTGLRELPPGATGVGDGVYVGERQLWPGVGMLRRVWIGGRLVVGGV